MSLTKFETEQMPSNLGPGGDSYSKEEIDGFLSTKLNKSGDTIEGPLVVPDTIPLTDNAVIPKKYVDKAIADIKNSSFLFRGFISLIAPVGPAVGNYWYVSDNWNMNFPWSVSQWNGTSWVSGTSYTPDTLDLWSKPADKTGWYYFGSHWSQLDFENTYNSDQFNVVEGRVSLKDGGITNTLLAGNIDQNKINGLSTKLGSIDSEISDIEDQLNQIGPQFQFNTDQFNVVNNGVNIKDGGIRNSQIASNAAIDISKTALTPGTGITISGNTISATGVSVPDASTVLKGIATLGAAGGAARYGQKSDVGLSNVDNTSDINKPISNATQTVLNNKRNIATGNNQLYATSSSGAQTTIQYSPTSVPDAIPIRESDGNIAVNMSVSGNYAIGAQQVDSKISDAISEVVVTEKDPVFTTWKNGTSISAGQNNTTYSTNSVSIGSWASTGGSARFGVAIGGHTGGVNAASVVAEAGVAIGTYSHSAAIESFQLGRGTNNTPRSLQFRNYQLVNEQGKIPKERLQNILVAGDGITIDETDPNAPIISASGGGGGNYVEYAENGSIPVKTGGGYLAETSSGDTQMLLRVDEDNYHLDLYDLKVGDYIGKTALNFNPNGKTIQLNPDIDWANNEFYVYVGNPNGTTLINMSFSQYGVFINTYDSQIYESDTWLVDKSLVGDGVVIDYMNFEGPGADNLGITSFEDVDRIALSNDSWKLSDAFFSKSFESTLNKLRYSTNISGMTIKWNGTKPFSVTDQEEMYRDAMISGGFITETKQRNYQLFFSSNSGSTVQYIIIVDSIYEGIAVPKNTIEFVYLDGDYQEVMSNYPWYTLIGTPVQGWNTTETKLPSMDYYSISGAQNESMLSTDTMWGTDMASISYPEPLRLYIGNSNIPVQINIPSGERVVINDHDGTEHVLAYTDDFLTNILTYDDDHYISADGVILGQFTQTEEIWGNQQTHTSIASSDRPEVITPPFGVKQTIENPDRLPWANGNADFKDPSPKGWRIPTNDELNALTAAGSGTWTQLNGINGRYLGGANNMFFPAAGYRNASGTMSNQGARGYYWSSSTLASVGAYNLDFDSDRSGDLDVNMYVDGYSIRCVRDTTTTDFTPCPAGEYQVGNIIWAKSNLSNIGTFAQNAEDYGAFFQWGQNVAIGSDGSPLGVRHKIAYLSDIPMIPPPVRFNVTEMFTFNPAVPGAKVWLRDDGQQMPEIEIFANNSSNDTNDLTITAAYGFGSYFDNTGNKAYILWGKDIDTGVSGPYDVTITGETDQAQSVITVPKEINHLHLVYSLGQTSAHKAGYWVDQNGVSHPFELENTPMQNLIVSPETTMVINGATVSTYNIKELVFGASFESVTSIPTQGGSSNDFCSYLISLSYLDISSFKNITDWTNLSFISISEQRDVIIQIGDLDASIITSVNTTYPPFTSAAGDYPFAKEIHADSQAGAEAFIQKFGFDPNTPIIINS